MNQARTSFGDPLIGANLAGRYRIELRVGSGAMGSVYRAEQAGLGRRVALKILNRERVAGGDTVQRFRREAQALSTLHHPNTVRVFDFGATDEGLLYLAMELLDGESLTDRMVRDSEMPIDEAVSIIQQVLRSIGEAHAHGIVHRDLKPDNVFLARVQNAPAPIVKVLDFGIAKAIDGERKIDQFETLDGTVFGTPRYMSPEQAGGRQLDPRSDLYAVGIMLYELLCGHAPFVDNDAVVVMARHIRETPPPVRQVAPLRPIPASLEQIVTRAIAKSPADRFQSAQEFEEALEDCMPAVVRLALASGSGLRAALARLALRPRLLWSIGLGFALSGLIAWMALQRHPDPQLARVLVPQTHPEPALHLELEPPREPESTAAEPVSERRVVSVQSSPAAAQVFQDGAKLGVTPLDVSMAAGTSLTLSLHKKGFAEHTLELHAEDGERMVMLRPLLDKPAPTSHRTRERTHKPQPAQTPAAAPEPKRAGQPSPYEKF